MQPDETARTSLRDQARWLSAARDQVNVEISEYHAHHDTGRGAHGPDSVRVPLAPLSASPVRNRHAARRSVLHAIAHPADSAHPEVLYGTAGCGKTALARSLFDEAATDGSVITLWVNAATEVSFRTGMLAVALDRGAHQSQVETARARLRPAADLVWERLENSPEPWLLVLDNADDPDVFNDGVWLRPTERGTVLVTTRHGDAPLWRHATRHHLDVLGIDDAVHVLQDLNITGYDRAALEQLAHGLGCHPLALTLAGAYLGGHQLFGPLDVTEFLTRLREDPGATLDEGAAPGERDVRRLISSTWQISLDALTDRGIPEATTLMWLLSCFAPDPIPLGLLHERRLATTPLVHAAPPLPAQRTVKALLGLMSQTMVTLLDVPGDVGAPGVKSVQAHSLLLDTVAARIPLDQRDNIHAAAALLLDGLLDQSEVEGSLDAQTLRLFTPHALSLLRRTSTARTAAAPTALAVVRRLREHSRAHGDITTTHSLAEAAARASATASTTSAEADVLNDPYALACSLTDMGRYEEALEAHRVILAAREEHLGADHPETLASAHSLGLALFGLGTWHENELHMRRAAKGRAQVLGSSHPDTVLSTACLAEVIGKQERYDEAESLARANFATSTTVHGADSPHTQSARHTLAWVLSRMGHLSEAADLTTITLAQRQADLGPRHPRTLIVHHLLAGVLLRQERWAQAASAARSVLATREDILGSEHPHTLAVRTALIRALTGLGDTTAAHTLATLNLEACSRVLGPDHPDTVDCRDAHNTVITLTPTSNVTPTPGKSKDIRR
ncbi:tetratricopeptide repeat protein [Streptomyces sp. NPDC102451]|uniref:tetratricopeptide repeat protein n=1 Tax=Streptomyces sp. NPDC102451 TaxID=3366177 RepID=UPI00382D9A9A